MVQTHELFLKAYNESLEMNLEAISSGVGTLKEKTLHAVLKNYFQADRTYQEVSVGRYIADICKGNNIIEIQTGNVGTMTKKLEYLVEYYNVMVVYPVVYEKHLFWVDTETGETTKKRKSPKKGNPIEVIGQLYNLKHMLLHPNLTFCVVMVNVDEYKYLNGYGKDKKKGASRIDRIPTSLEQELYLMSKEDYKAIMPVKLADNFTAKDFKKATSLSPRQASSALNVLRYINVVERCGKVGNAFIYKIL